METRRKEKEILVVRVENGIGISLPEVKHRNNLAIYQNTFLQVPKIEDRKPVFISHEVRDRLDRIVRMFGDRRMSVSGMVENIIEHHLAAFEKDIETWRKL